VPHYACEQAKPRRLPPSLTDTVPAGTSVLVKIYAWPYFFQIRGTVCYPEHALGVVVAFEEIESDYASALEACLLEAEQNRRKHSNTTTDGWLANFGWNR
jgi:hypothetical protein